MDLIIIRSEAERKAAIDRLDRAQLPAVLEIRGGVELRSTAQNAAYRSLVGQIASMTGQEPAELHRHFGRRFLDFDEDRVGAFGALVPSSTRRLSKDEMSDLIAQVHATAAWLGIEGIERGMVQQVGRRGGQIMTNDSMRQKALASALGQIENQFGKGAVMRMGEAGPVANVQTVSSGSLGLDIALGIGGVPRGRIVEAYGPEASGKTTLALHRQAIEHNHPLHQPDPNENWSDVRQPRDHNRRQCAQILRLVAARHPTRRQHQKR